MKQNKLLGLILVIFMIGIVSACTDNSECETSFQSSCENDGAGNYVQIFQTFGQCTGYIPDDFSDPENPMPGSPGMCDTPMMVTLNCYENNEYCDDGESASCYPFPTIEINYPVTDDYITNISNISYTVTSDIANYRNCWYSLDNGITNSSEQIGGASWTNLISEEGSNTWTIYCKITEHQTTPYTFSDTVTFTKETPVESVIIPQSYWNTAPKIETTNENLTTTNEGLNTKTAGIGVIIVWFQNIYEKIIGIFT